MEYIYIYIYISYISVAILAQATDCIKYYLGNISLFSAGCDRRPLWVTVLLFIIVGSSAYSGMPHTRSIAGKRNRTTRALRLGYAPSCNDFTDIISVPSHISSATRAAARSLADHFSHDNLTSESNHFARLASLHAHQQGHLSDDQAKQAAIHHRDAGRLKHGISAKIRKPRWTDLVDDCNSPIPPVSPPVADFWEDLVDDDDSPMAPPPLPSPRCVAASQPTATAQSFLSEFSSAPPSSPAVSLGFLASSPFSPLFGTAPPRPAQSFLSEFSFPAPPLPPFRHPLVWTIHRSFFRIPHSPLPHRRLSISVWIGSKNF